MTYEFPPDLNKFLAGEIRRGEYETEEAFFSDLLRMLKQEREEAIEGIHEGLKSMQRGEGTPVEEVIARLRENHDMPKES